MTIEEYSSRMGYAQNCEMEEYATANTAYMMAGDMDKDAFCKEWKRHGSSPLVRLLAVAANSGDVARREAMAKERQTAHALLRQADAIRGGLVDNDEMAETLERMAAKMIGRKDCVIRKMDKGFALGEADMAYIRDNLK